MPCFIVTALVTAMAVAGNGNHSADIALPAVGAESGEQLGPSLAADQQQWWESLQALCGKAYEGRLIRAPQGDDTFRDKRVVMHVRDCSADRIRIPVAIGDNLSRTWVFTREGDRLLFRHDHRHEDGTPEAMTDYGGHTGNAGSADTTACAVGMAGIAQVARSSGGVAAAAVTGA